MIDYNNERKMILAKEMILNDEISLVETAEQLGFDNYNYFSRIFKNYYGIRPIAFRKKAREK